MTLILIERLAGWLGGLAVLVTLAAIFYGLWRGLRRSAGRATGRMPGLLRSPAFYIFASLGYFGLCYLLWRPIPLDLSPSGRVLALSLGGLLFFPGLGLVLWGRLALGKLYFVSTSMGAQLYADHQLITRGPYAWVRHPMYLGLMLVGLGGILLYRTWAFVFVALGFLGLVWRARREEEALAAEFGEQWQAYCRRTPPWIPSLRWDRPRQSLTRLPPGAAALLEIGLLFLPAIPAYLWMWPNVSGTSEWIAQIVTYVYVLGGTLTIGLRRWRPGELGVNRDGIGLSLACGAALLAGRLLIIRAVDFGLERPVYNLAGLVGLILYYFGLVGLVEELLFRGLVYQALQAWLGVRWAIWGSSIGFILWHIFGQGPLAGAAGFLVGMIFALVRWRAGGILGLVLVHGLYDLETVLLVSSSNQEILDLSRLAISNLFLAYLGFAVMLGVPFYLWKLHPRVERLLQRRTGQIK